MWRYGKAATTMGVLFLAAACGGHGAGTVPSTSHPLTGAAADHSRMVDMRVRLDDLGPNWRQVEPRPHQPATCEPDPKNVSITAGSWTNRGVAFMYGSRASIESDALVFATPKDAETALAAFMQRSNIRCLEREMKAEFKPRHGLRLLGLTDRLLARRGVGDAFDGYRVTMNLARGKRIYQIYADVLVMRQDRAIAAFTYANAYEPAPETAELSIAQALANRGALAE
jgi:hypothetical protein